MSQQHQFSLLCLIFSIIILFSAAFGFYSKWQKPHTEATLSWDVSGYYMYLPAFFIYKDLKQVQFLDKIIKEYKPSPYPGQAFQHESGSMVMKYSMGLAVQYLPFFAIGHGVATLLEYPADGFSYPYQVAISWGSLLVAFLGLYFLRKNLRTYFSDVTVGLTLLALVLGTNYLEYASITGAMSHNYLFTCYSLLIALSISYHRQPSWWKGLGIGALIGLMALTRPTEIIACLIPLCWGISSIKSQAVAERLQFFRKHSKSVLLAILMCLMVGSLQVLYWKYVSGDWIVYSYQDQGFSWFNPHLYGGLFTFRAGWLVYTPMMVFALIGFVPLWRKHRSIFWAVGSFLLLFIYITFAWDIWWYGGSLGQRAMVQAYAVLAFPLAAFIQWMSSKKLWKWLLLAIALLFSYYNIWLTYQAHGGGLLVTDGSTTRAYFWKTIGRYNVPLEAVKLLDTNEEFTGKRKKVQLMYEYDFETDTLRHDCGLEAIEGQGSLCLNENRKHSPTYQVALKPQDAEWLRVAVDARIGAKEWNSWNMAQLIVKFKHKNESVKVRKIRIQRLLNNNETKRVYIDTKLPHKTFDHLEVILKNDQSTLPILIDNLRVESYKS